MRIVVDLLTFRCLTWSEFPREIWIQSPFPISFLLWRDIVPPAVFFILSLIICQYHFQTNFQTTRSKAWTLLIIHEILMLKFFTHNNSTITKYRVYFFIQSLNLEYVKIPTSINLIQTRKKEKRNPSSTSRAESILVHPLIGSERILPETLTYFVIEY